MQVLENLWRASLQVFFDCYGILNVVNTEPLLNFLHLTLDSIWETVLQRQYLQKQERWWKCHSTLVLNIFWSMFPGVIYFFPLISFVIFSLIEEGFWWISCLFICLLVFSNCALELFTFIAEREHHSFFRRAPNCYLLCRLRRVQQILQEDALSLFNVNTLLSGNQVKVCLSSLQH